jgi:hypothetical protein
MNPDTLKSSLQREFQLTCTIVETLVLSPSQKIKINAIRKSNTVFNKLWQKFEEYYAQLNQIKPLILKIYDFQTQEHFKDHIKLYTSNPQIGQWIMSIKAHPHYHSEFKKYLGHLKKNHAP